MVKVSPKRIIINGDLKHDFGSISEDEWRDVLELIDFLEKYAPVEVVKGNHDTIVLPILKKRSIPVRKFIIIDSFLIMHGDVLPEKKLLDEVSTLIIGHEHPSLLLNDGLRKEKYKCFLVGIFCDKALIVLPSLFPLVEGSDVLREKALGPIFKEASNIDVHVVDGLESLYFGPLDNLDKKL